MQTLYVYCKSYLKIIYYSEEVLVYIYSDLYEQYKKNHINN